MKIKGTRSIFCSKCGNVIEPARQLKQAYCRGCHNANMRETRKDQYKNLSEEDKKKMKARSKISMWIKRNNFLKPGCQICSCKKVEMHHFDYDKAYEVAFLCKEHHIDAHKGRIVVAFKDFRIQ